MIGAKAESANAICDRSPWRFRIKIIGFARHSNITGLSFMQDVLIPIGLLVFIGFFIHAMIHTGRKPRAAKRDIFKTFASRKKLRCGQEVQVRGSRVAAYPADRNAKLEDVDMLEDLFGFARSAARAMYQASD